ncbi:unnamed protein product [Malus baccata var. baccata]
MDLNHSINFSSSSSTSSPFDDFMPLDSFMLPDCDPHLSTKEVNLANFLLLVSYARHDHEEDHEAKRSSFTQLQKENIDLFWNQQLFEIQNTPVRKTHHEFPIARVKRIMKSDGKVKLISSETPILFSKACELFIMELTLRSWLHTEESKRRTLQHCDISRALRNDQLLDFLVSIANLF